MVADAAALAGSVCASSVVARSVLTEVVTEALASEGLDPELAIVLTSDPLACTNLFYLPLANDVRGIGYEHEDAREVFDDSPDTALEGIAFLNDFPYWQAHPEELPKAFNHELAHRWGARVHARGAGDSGTDLLGREQQHWSYFLDTGGSPLEGNAWNALDATTFVFDTPSRLRGFSDFDLYLMGSLPADEVDSELLLRTEDGASDCASHPLTAASPPQSCGPLELGGETASVALDDVIAAEGERTPPPDATPRTVSIAVVVLASGHGLEPGQCRALADTLPPRLADFASATRGRLTLTNVADGGPDCGEIAVAKQAPPLRAHGCGVAPRSVPAGERGACWLLLALLCARRAHDARSRKRH